jgi:hypothetical protein
MEGRKEGRKGKLRRGSKQPNDNIPHALQCSLPEMSTETLS